ncbi:septum formation initiator family protein [Lentibacter algarum]|uniref:FtsB family cell division protein n=1 Tax=Lentibacter algarum TaxID=576131 RepID=UPI001C08FF75|nr:septum formation initiator family protein [Lentibacter algarum]MBU2982659.1 septum formation initiator family protein [Lentibacter algarum]
MIPRRIPALGMPIGTLIFFALAFCLSLYFVFAAIQGDYGLFRRAEIEAEHLALTRELNTLQARVDRMQNLTHRLSDDYLDVDLLDERARDILGYVRADEIVIH